MSDTDETLARLTRIVRANLNDSTLPVTLETRPEAVPGWDSIKMVDIILDLEDAFEIRLTAEDIDGLRDVAGLVSCIHSRVSA